MTQKTLIPLPIQSGINTEQTARGAAPNWKDGDKVRFRLGLPEKLGGWVRLAGGQFLGIARKLWDWASLDSLKWVSVGTESKLYLWQSGVYSDVTPLRAQGTLSNPFSTTSGLSTVVVNHVAHGVQPLDYVRFSGSTPLGGLTVDGQYQVQSVTDSDNYVIVDDQVASSTVNLSGGTVGYQYDISVGLSSASFGVGWGTGTWSQETWSTPRTVSNTVLALRLWSLDNWGEDLIANPRGGFIYWWDRGTGVASRAALLAAAPRALYTIVSQRDRHLIAFGCTDAVTGEFDTLLIRWCSKEDFNDWIPSTLNTAGDARIESGSKIVAAVKTRGEILIWTDISVHQMNYVGGNDVYTVNGLGQNISLLGPNALIEVNSRVYAMADGDFFIYDGLMRPLPCTVRDYVFKNLNVFQKEKSFAGLNRAFNEIFFFYPGKADNVWIELDYTAGLLENLTAIQSMAGTQRYSVLFNSLGFVYAGTHTNNTLYDSTYFLSAAAAAPIDDLLAVDYEATFILNGLTGKFGLIIEATDLTGTADTSADNMKGISVDIDCTTGRAFFRNRSAGGVLSTLTNSVGAGYLLSALGTPITLVSGRTYGILITRSVNNISGYLYDANSGTTQLIATVALAAGEITLYPGTVGRPGFVFRYAGQTIQAGDVRLLSLRAAPTGVLIAQTQRGVASEVNRYVIFNYQEDTWSIGTMSRSTWHDSSPVLEAPYAAGLDGFLYQHETTNDDNGAAMVSYLKTYDMEIPEEGDQIAHIDKYIPDFKELEGTVQVSFTGKKYPQTTTSQTKGPYTVSSATTKQSMRIRARQISLELRSSAVGDRWRMGTLRLRAMGHGKRT